MVLGVPSAFTVPCTDHLVAVIVVVAVMSKGFFQMLPGK
jgi:hypothetical protein